ncbi:TIR domain-containing protein [Tunturiibacter gelidiferens]|uniref:TIR domain-containing protein n=1 Tax=Tunturiibacter gelidiferens TaxID=3069689 RepID=UPI003D9B6D22
MARIMGIEPKLVVTRKIAGAGLEKQIAEGEKLLERPITDSVGDYQQFQNDVMLWKSHSIVLVGTFFDTDQIKRNLTFSLAVALPRSPIHKKWEQLNKESGFFQTQLRSILKNLVLYKVKRKPVKKLAPSNKVLRKEKYEGEWDLFISHASEDKERVAKPLAEKLRKQKISGRLVRVWYDEFSLGLGDSLRASIDKGLTGSRFGVVILSKNFFKKDWTKKELNGLFALDSTHKKRILPVWHRISASEIAEFSPMLADKLGVNSRKGWMKSPIRYWRN